jgi:pyruvate, water dikinase
MGKGKTMTNIVFPLTQTNANQKDIFGPKAANLAALAQNRIPTPGGYAVDANAYRLQMTHLDLWDAAKGVFGGDDYSARRHANRIRIQLLEQPLEKDIENQLLTAFRSVIADGSECVIRSSALVEDRYGSSFAGQFESFLGISSEEEFLVAVRSCWCALWSTRALRYMATHDIDPYETAMGLIVQPLIEATVSGGGLSQTAEGDILISATWGLGSSIAQGEVVPDRYVLTRDGELMDSTIGQKAHSVNCSHGSRATHTAKTLAACLDIDQLKELVGYIKQSEGVVNGPSEVEWAMNEKGIFLVQARPLHVESPIEVDEVWQQHPKIKGHPSGVGWATGKACVVNCECEISRIGPGDILITKIAGPALSHILGQVAGVVAELGGSTSHLASLARERGIPMVLGVLDATQRIPEGSVVAVDGVAGVVRWIENGSEANVQ